MKLSYEDIDVNRLITLAIEAGEKIMKIYATDFSVETKDDKSPLTEADRASNAVILAGLQKLYPHIPFISEETKLTPYETRKHWNRLWLIDPIDGTKEFIKRNGEFTVNIALIENGIPVVGVVAVPAQSIVYAGIKGIGSFVTDNRAIAFRPLPDTAHHQQVIDKIVVVASRSHLSAETTAFIENLKATGKEVEFLSSGSSLKFCLVAEGKADVYPRFAPTMEWDTAAAHAVALYAGRQVINRDNGQPLVYNKENLLNPWFIVQ